MEVSGMSGNRFCVAAIGFVSLAVLLTPSLAQKPMDREPSMGMRHNRLSGTDKKFMFKASQGGIAEVKLGELAQRNASSGKVKDFASRMVTDHSKANDELKELARNKGVALASDMDYMGKQTWSRLSRLHGPAFDRAYTQAMVKD